MPSTLALLSILIPLGLIVAALVWYEQRRRTNTRPTRRRSEWIDTLTRACYHDRGQALRLMDYEREKRPGIGDEEAARLAYERLMRDRER